MSDIIIWIFGGIAMVIGYILLQAVLETVLAAILMAVYLPFKPVFDWLIFDRPFWKERTFWREMNDGLRLALVLVGSIVAIILFLALMHYQEFKDG